MSVGAAEGFHSFQLSKRNLFIENFLSQKSAQKKNSPGPAPTPMHLKITNKHFPMQTSYYLDEYIIQQSQSATYLGVKIDQRLKWSEHTSSTISKANAANAFLKRSLSGCSSKVKKNCYLSMVRPILEYASIVWSPHTQCDIHKIEMVQRCAVRFNIFTISVVQLVLQTCL